MSASKHIRMDEKITGFRRETGNPHSILFVTSIQGKIISCECLETREIHVLHHKERKLPFFPGQYILVQEKQVPGDDNENIFKIKDAKEKPNWKNGESYTPAFAESIKVSLEQVPV